MEQAPLEEKDKRKMIRPIIETVGTVDQSQEEAFQNQTLRPIIKLQHDLLVAVFQNYIATKKLDFEALAINKKKALIATVFQNDNNFKLEIRGLILGHFTVDEYLVYTKIATEINKRIINIVKERLQSLYHE